METISISLRQEQIEAMIWWRRIKREERDFAQVDWKSWWHWNIGRIIRDDRSGNLFDLVTALIGGHPFEYEYPIEYFQ